MKDTNVCDGVEWFGNTMPPEILAATNSSLQFEPVFRVDRLTDIQRQKAMATTWKPCCPVPLEDLRAISISHWNYNGLGATGILIAHSRVSEDLLFIFKELFAHGFLIERMRPVEDFGGDDELSMENNNTSAFNCRPITGQPGTFSKHSWGTAIDINPLYNPYVAEDTVLPRGGSLYLDRSRAWPGSILSGSIIVKLFRDRGWTWGGSWSLLKDYQHFEIDL